MHRFTSRAASHVGLKRRLQEDAVLERPEIGLWAVVDGMGGHHRGDLASRRIVDGLAALKAPSTASSFLVSVQACLAAAHDDLNAVPAAGDALPGGATCVVLMVWREHFTCLWAGDARLYQLRAGRLRQVTRDHSRVRELVDEGAIDEKAARDHPQANVVTRAIGAGTRFQPEVARGAALPGDCLILCSDGVTRVLEDDTLAEIVTAAGPIDAAEAMIAAVLDAGAPDNASAVVVTLI